MASEQADKKEGQSSPKKTEGKINNQDYIIVADSADYKIFFLKAIKSGDMRFIGILFQIKSKQKIKNLLKIL